MLKMKGIIMNEALFEYLTEVSSEYQDEYDRLMELMELEDLL
jgi:hypothetical protein